MPHIKFMESNRSTFLVQVDEFTDAFDRMVESFHRLYPAVEIRPSLWCSNQYLFSLKAGKFEVIEDAYTVLQHMAAEAGYCTTVPPATVPKMPKYIATLLSRCAFMGNTLVLQKKNKEKYALEVAQLLSWLYKSGIKVHQEGNPQQDDTVIFTLDGDIRFMREICLSEKAE